MKKLLLLFIVVLSTTACTTSSGEKYGTIQKITRKSPPFCNVRWEVEMAYIGGRAVEDGYQNTQLFNTSMRLADALKKYQGKPVIIYYDDRGYEGYCLNARTITGFKDPETGAISSGEPEKQCNCSCPQGYVAEHKSGFDSTTSRWIPGEGWPCQVSRCRFVAGVTHITNCNNN